TAVVEERQWPIRRRPGIAREQTGDNGVRWTTKRGNLARIRNARRRVQSDAFALTFVSEVKERLVAFDWTTDRAAELIVSERGLRVGLDIEEVASVECVVAEKLEDRAVKIVGAGLGDD